MNLSNFTTFFLVGLISGFACVNLSGALYLEGPLTPFLCKLRWTCSIKREKMGSTFNPQILMEKLVKLNNSQQSIETLSHWCIFHMNKAKFVVDTWARQFHCSPRDQRLAFLYLANDILQNSRRKGVEFVAEFWRVLPDALHDVIRNGDDAGRNAARRLISIWDERKVFGSRGHILKEEFVSKPPENSNRNGRQPNLKLRQSAGNVLDKVVSDYEILYGGELVEDALMIRCTSTISALEKIVQDLGPGVNSGKFSGPGSTEELQGQQASLKECIEQLTALESSRASLVSHLRDFLQDQELKLDRVRNQLQAAQLQSDQVSNICGKLINSGNIEQGSSVPPGFTPGESQPPPIVYTRQVPLENKAAPSDDDSRKSTAADVAAKLTASTSSAEMLSFAFTSMVSGVTLTNSSNNNLSGAHESPSDRQLEKRPKLEEDSSYYPSPPPLPPSPPPPPPLPISQHVTPGEQPPPPPSSPPPLPPLPPMMPPYPMQPQFIQTAGPMSNVAYTFGVTPPPPPPPPFNGLGYPSVGPPMTGMPPYGHPVNPFQNYQISESGIYNPSSVPMAPMPHQQSL